MPVAVMDVREMRMSVAQRRMDVPVRVGLSGWHAKQVLMSMMLIVDMRVLMLERLVDMLVAMPLGHVEPHAAGHQHCGPGQPQRQRLPEGHYGTQGAQKRSG